MFESKVSPSTKFEFHKEMAEFCIEQASFERARHHIGKMHEQAHTMSGSEERAAFEAIRATRERMR